MVPGPFSSSGDSALCRLGVLQDYGLSKHKFMLVGQDMFENFAPNETAL